MLCGWGADAGAGHFWDIRPAVNVLAGANPDVDIDDGALPARLRNGAELHVVSVRHFRTTEDFVVRRARLSLSSRASKFSGSLSEIVVMTVG